MSKLQSRSVTRRPTPTGTPKPQRSPKHLTPLQLPRLKLKKALLPELDHQDFEEYVGSIVSQLNGMLERLENIKEFRID